MNRVYSVFLTLQVALIPYRSDEGVLNDMDPHLMELEADYFKSLNQAMTQMEQDLLRGLPARASKEFIFNLFSSVSLTFNLLSSHPDLMDRVQTFVQQNLHHTSSSDFTDSSNSLPHLLNYLIYYGSPAFDFIIPDFIDCMISSNQLPFLLQPTTLEDFNRCCFHFLEEHQFSCFSDYIQYRQSFLDFQKLSSVMLPLEPKNKHFRL